MYLAIIVLPLLGSIVSGFFGRKIGVSGAQIITTSCVILTTIFAIVSFFEVGLNNIPVSIELFTWIDSESLNVYWGFHFDSLTVSMLIPVLIVSSLVHCYSIGYMKSDPRGGVMGKRVYGDKLSNSGDILKLKVPNYSRKAISGWSNYSEMVTSLKMSENEMDDRGSKSTILNNIVVKEQRVDGNWYVKSDLMYLRCTLGGSERNRGIKLSFNMQQCWNSRVKIPSKQLDLKTFSTYNSFVNPGLWSGLIDAEGSFSLIVTKDETRKLGWRTEIKFQMGLHTKDLNLLYLLQQQLGAIGCIHLAQNREIVNYTINSIEDINKLILYLEKYPLLTQKAADFSWFFFFLKKKNKRQHL